MASPLTPRASPFAAQTVISKDSPGSWSHPRLAEINQRLNQTTFDERNVRSILINTAFLLLTLLIPRAADRFELTRKLVAWIPWYAAWLLIATRLIPAWNVYSAIKPALWAPKDGLTNVPLTPRQRSLLGLAGANPAPTPGSTYITPPRYSRSVTPRSDASSRSGSPYSGNRGTAASRGSPLAATGYSPSPLLQRAVHRDTNRRLSFGNSPSPKTSMVNEPNFSASSLSLNTPSPSDRTGSGSNLPNKWLYERGRSSSGLY